MNKCKACLMLREVRKLKVEIISFEDSEESPHYCRKCYQTERAKNAKLKKLLQDALPHIECTNASQSGLITEIGQALKDK